MTEQEAIQYLENHGYIDDAVKDMAIKALEKQKELRENCEGSCYECKYRGEFHCANDLLIDREVGKNGGFQVNK